MFPAATAMPIGTNHSERARVRAGAAESALIIGVNHLGEVVVVRDVCCSANRELAGLRRQFRGRSSVGLVPRQLGAYSSARGCRIIATVGAARCAPFPANRTSVVRSKVTWRLQGRPNN